MNSKDFNPAIEIAEFDEAMKAREASRRRAARRRKTDRKKKNRRKEIVRQSSFWDSTVGWVSENKAGGEYVKLPKNSNRQRYLKKQTHRRNRRRPIEEDDYARKGNAYRRSVDYFWELE